MSRTPKHIAFAAVLIFFIGVGGLGISFSKLSREKSQLQTQVQNMRARFSETRSTLDSIRTDQKTQIQLLKEIKALTEE